MTNQSGQREDEPQIWVGSKEWVRREEEKKMYEAAEKLRELFPSKPLPVEGEPKWKPLPQDEEQNLRCAKSIAEYMAERFYPEVAQWKPLEGDMFGLLSQISNMSTGLQRKPELPVERPELPALGQLRPDLCPWCGQFPEVVQSMHAPHFYVSCANEKCPVQPETDIQDGEEVAIMKWNHRY